MCHLSVRGDHSCLHPQVQEVLQDLFSMLGRDGFRMKLHAECREFSVRSPMMMPVDVHAVHSRQAGSVVLSTINEWYLVAVNGIGMFSKSPMLVVHFETFFRATISGAFDNPSSQRLPIAGARADTEDGIFLVKFANHFKDDSCVAGVQGPGEITILSGFIRRMSEIDT